ncbi:hypothetical protein BDQ17DRAFT_1359240 [Cyathus striatus]|nr:hypothetical protein BDQ17DRAFT_1359240 [Cyathus striatus]
MRFGTFLGAALSLGTLLFAVSASPLGDSNEPEIIATAAFPETNAFNHVVNGEKNALTISVENKSDRNVTLVSVTGSLHHPDTNALIKNLTTLKYGVPVLEGVKIQLPYAFHSEYRDHRLTIWLEHVVDDDTYRVNAFDSIVTVVEPAVSIFDLKLLSTYLIVAGILGGLVYLAYLSFVPQSKKTRSKKATVPSVSSPIGSVTATGAGGYQEEWIPEHHLRKTKSKKQVDAVSGTSGDELSGGEISGAEMKKRKGRK